MSKATETPTTRQAIKKSERGMIEPSPAPEFFVSGLGLVEPLGSCVRLWWYTWTVVVEGPDRQHRVVVNRMILPADALGTVARQLMASPEAQQLDAHGFSAAN